MGDILEVWYGEVEVRRQVKVTDAPELVVPSHPGMEFQGRPRRYRLHQVDILSRWTPGAVGTLVTYVTLRVHEVIGGHVLTHRDGKMYPDQLQEVPAWLVSIIGRATVRCRCRHLGSAHGGEEPAEVVTDGCPVHLLDLLPPPPPDAGPEPF